MELSCIHTHTSFCDGKGEPRDFCEAALKKGFKSLGFSAHAPLEKKTGFKSEWNLKDERLEEYLDSIRKLKRLWEGKLKIHLGLEVDFIPGLIAPSDRDFQNLGLDYIIGSVHFVVPPRGAPFTVDSSPEELESGLKLGFGGDREALVNAYWDSVEGMIRGGGFDVLGHADLIKKNNAQCRLFAESDGFYRRRCEAVADLASGYGVTAELNTGGMNRKKIAEPYPSLSLLIAFKEKNIPIVINADAHNPGDLDGHYPDAIKTMNAAGYKNTMVFEGKKDGRPEWKNVNLNHDFR